MKTIRVFISSPGDVKDERETSEAIIRRISSEFGLPIDVSYSVLLRKAESPHGDEPAEVPEQEEALVLCPYFWEYQRYNADEGYQEQIPRTDSFDLVVCILWSRIGTRLGAHVLNPDQTIPRSGTEYEIQWAREARRLAREAKPDTPPLELTPALHVYRNTSTPVIASKSGATTREFADQQDSLEAFISEWQRAEDGSFKGAFNTYRDLGEFERKFEAHMRDFLRAFLPANRPVPTRPRDPLWAPAKRGSPFRRLDVYEPEHEPIFCGRRRAAGQVLAALRRQHARGTPFVLILGASGSGKSSLARAGVLPMLVNGRVIDGIEHWRHAVLRPGGEEHGGNPCLALAAALLTEPALPALRDPASDDPVGKLGQQLARNPEAFVDRIEDQLNFHGREKLAELHDKLEKKIDYFTSRGRPGDVEALKNDIARLTAPKAGLILIVDQAEELFHSDRDPALVASFIAALSNLARSTSVMVLITLRSDYYDHFQRSGLLDLTHSDGRVDLLPPDSDEVGQIIRLPASAAGLRYDEDADGKSLDEELRDHARSSPDSLPLLSHLLDLLYEKQKVRGDGWLRWQDYEELGSFSGALSRHAESIHDEKLDDAERSALHAVFGGLVHFGHADRGEDLVLRKDAHLRTLITDPKGGEIPGARSLIEKLSAPDARLLSMRGNERGGESSVTISHEILLRQWPRIRDWLRENEHLLRLQQTVAPDAANWKAQGKPDDLLIRNTSRLEKLKPLLGAAFGEPVVAEYVLASLRVVEADEIARHAVGNTVEARLEAFRTAFPEAFDDLLDRLLTKESEEAAVNTAISLFGIGLPDADRRAAEVFAHLSPGVPERRLALSIIQRPSDPTFGLLDQAVSKGDALLKWAILLTVSDRNSTDTRVRSWLHQNRQRDWRRILWKSKLVRLKLTVPELIVGGFLAVLLASLGAGLGKFNTVWGHSAVLDRPFFAVGLFEGVLAALVLGGPVALGLIACSGIFSLRATPKGLFKPLLPLFAGSLLGLLGGAVLSLIVLLVCSEQTVTLIGWREGSHPSLLLRPFVDPANLRGWIFPVTSIGFGLGMALCSNLISARESARGDEAVRAPLRTLRDIAALFSSAVRRSVTVLPILALTLAVTVVAAYSLRFSPASLLGFDREFLGRMFDLKVENAVMPTAADSERIRVWKRSEPGLLAGIAGDAFTKFTGGFGALIGLFFGRAVLRRGFKLDTQDES